MLSEIQTLSWCPALHLGTICRMVRTSMNVNIQQTDKEEIENYKVPVLHGTGDRRLESLRGAHITLACPQ